MPWLLGVLAAATLAVAAHAHPVFTDVTSAAGVGYLQHSGQAPPDCLFFGDACDPERMTGGAAAGDADGDGDVDLFVTRLDDHDLLFCNRLSETGSAVFQDCSAAAGLDAFDLRSNGAAWGDVDNDGDLDLYVTTVANPGATADNRYYLFVNDGSGQFSEEAVLRGAEVPSAETRIGMSVAFGDYDRDGWLDLHVGEWRPTAFLGVPGAPSHVRLLRNLGYANRGHFSDVTVAAGVSFDPPAPCGAGEPCGAWAFASSFTDLDGDGWPDLAVAADFGTSRLFWNQGDGSFVDGTQAAGVGTDENGMGSSFGDYDGDGDLDWFVTSIGNEPCGAAPCAGAETGNRLYRNEGGRVFTDVTDAAGVREGFWGWGAAFLDYDNDGDLDIAMTNGVDFPQKVWEDPYNADPMRFWENDGTGVMTERSASVGLTDTASGKGLLHLDYDDDGDLDLFVVNNAAGPVLYRNDGGNDNDWLRVKVVGRGSNRDGIGAVVTLTSSPGAASQVREIGAASHFLGQSEGTAHFGLGPGLGPGPGPPVHELRVFWPRTGRTRVWHDLGRNLTVLAREPRPCGLLGIEPWLVFGLASLARRSRRQGRTS